MGQGRAQIYNLISILFLLLSIVGIVFVVLRLAGPIPQPRAEVVVPTMAIVPTATNTLTWTPTYTSTATDTPTRTLTPSITPSITWTQIPTLTPSLTFTVAPTNTPAPSATTAPSATIAPSETIVPSATTVASATVGPTATLGPTSTTGPTFTFTPSQTITDTLVVPPTTIPSITPTVTNFTPEPTQPPPSPFPFVLRDNQVIYTLNFANTAGCAWQGIGGQVFDLSDQPLTQIRVHVFGQGVDLYTASGSNALYGLSGWEVPLSTTLTSNSYVVELQSAQGTIISPQITVTFTPDCGKNLALVSFEQTRPF